MPTIGPVDELFCEAAKRRPENPFLALIGPAGTVERTSYATAAIRVAGVVQRLEETGVRKGDMVACYLDDIVPSLYFWLGCFTLGVVPIPLSPTFSVDMLLGIVRRTNARVFFTTESGVARLAAHGIRPLCFVDDDGMGAAIEPLPTRPALAFEEALRILDGAAKQHSADDALVVIPTSGTTGEPKLPVWSHHTMNRAAANLLRAMDLWGRDAHSETFLLVNALTHGLGMTNAFAATMVGAEIAVPSRVDVHSPLDEVRRLDFTYSFMTPRVVRSLIDQQERRGEAGARLLGPRARVIAFAGAPSDRAVMRLLESQRVSPVDVWGSGETGNIACSRVGAWREGQLGKPFADTQVKVADDGELLVRAEHMMMGYFGDEKLTREAYTDDGFYRTGDAGEITADGDIRITGRKKDVFNTIEGSNVYPSRIEAQCESLSWVRQVVLVGDRLPFMTALVVVDEADCGVREADGIDADGYMAPEAYPAAYERARHDFAKTNRSLESIERVRRFALFARSLHEEAYQVVSVGKVRRNRRTVATLYGRRIEALYASDAPSDICVPEGT